MGMKKFPEVGDVADFVVRCVMSDRYLAEPILSNMVEVGPAAASLQGVLSAMCAGILEGGARIVVPQIKRIVGVRSQS